MSADEYGRDGNFFIHALDVDLVASIVYLACEPLYKKDGLAERTRGVCAGLARSNSVQLHVLASPKAVEGETDHGKFREYIYRTFGRTTAYFAVNFFEMTGISSFLRARDLRKVYSAIEVADVVVYDDLSLIKGLAKFRTRSKNGKNMLLVFNSANVYKHPSKLEMAAALESDLVLVCSEEERALFVEKYSMLGIDEKKIVVLQNGMTPAKASAREKFVKRTFFIGSAYKPNVDAVKFICELSKRLIGWEHVVVGGVCERIEDKAQYPEMSFLGKLERAEIDREMEKCGVALCPLFEGSGTSLKMVDYLTHAIPTVSTKLGARGLHLQPGKHYLEAETIDGFVNALNMLESDNAIYRSLSRDGKAVVDEMFDWDRLVERVNSKIAEVLAERLGSKT